MSRWSDALAARITITKPVDTSDTSDTLSPERNPGHPPTTTHNLVETSDTSDTSGPQRPQVSEVSQVSTPIIHSGNGVEASLRSPYVTGVPGVTENDNIGGQGSRPAKPPSSITNPVDTCDTSDTLRAERTKAQVATGGSFYRFDKTLFHSQSDLDQLARLEALKTEIQSARQIFHAELAAVAPILGDIFKEWPGAQITGVVEGPPPSEETGAPRSEPPPPEAVERRAHELLAKAESTIGVEITDRMKALDYYRARAIAELRSKA